MYNPDPNNLGEAAVLHHEMYVSFWEAGFSKHEIWHLMLNIVDCDQPECHTKG